MILPDVNVLIYAHRREHAEHPEYAGWLRGVAESREPFALSELVCSSFVRIATNRRVFDAPTALESAIEFVDRLRRRPRCTLLRPGPEHWSHFTELCRQTRASGKLIADAYHAALAIEHGCEWVTADADFARFPGLRWRHPLKP